MRPKRSNIRKSLLDQMQAKGMSGKHFIDLAEDYMSFYDRKTELLADLESRGTMVEVESPKGVFNVKSNPALLDLIKVNKAMNDMLKNLGLNEPDGAGDMDVL